MPIRVQREIFSSHYSALSSFIVHFLGLQLLNQHRPQIVHFSGHGSEAGLTLASNDGNDTSTKIPFSTLKGNIRLIFLNACYSHKQAQAFVTTIDCVIGMKKSIRDDAAIVFASSFYRALGFGHSIKGAFDQGITALLLENIPEEDTPQLLRALTFTANTSFAPGSGYPLSSFFESNRDLTGKRQSPTSC